MPANSESMTPTGSNRHRPAAGSWLPRGVLAWVLAVVAFAVAVLMAVLVVCMAFPIRWDGLGIFGALALFFPLHLLAFTLVAAVLAFIARQCRAKLAAWVCILVVTLTAAMALTPTVAMWERAREWNVPLSLGTYLANARHMNSGPPQTDRSVVYGTTKDGTKLELDVWRTGQPNTGPLRPAVVFVHGGAWVHGTHSMLPDWDRWLNELGYEVFDVEYRMPPPVRWQEEIGDVKSALGWWPPTPRRIMHRLREVPMQRTHRFVLELVFIALATGYALSGALATDELTLVRIESGKVRGTAADHVIVFKGIPFAKPPVGALRWRAPQPVAAWKGVLEASAFKKDCIQTVSALGSKDGFSEDCLYLNVWRPTSIRDKPLPVMIWLPGGGLVRGGASLYPLDNFARKGIVVVSLSYRLGRLGFFAHPALARDAPDDLRGNYGYMDQVAVLKWVQRNIAAFGGDPNNVTITGESAGGGSVLVMLTSPMTRGLFHRAILQSPGLPTPRAGATALSDLATAESIAVAYASANGIKGDDGTAVAALRALPAETLAKGTEPDIVILGVFGGPKTAGIANAIIDGRLMVETPEAALRAGRQAMVPLIAGGNDMDLAMSPAKDKDELFAQFGPLASQARALYDPKGNASLKDLIQAVVADRTFLEPPRYLAEVTGKAGQRAYFYRFSYVPPARRGVVPGASHGAEIVYAFDGVAAVFKDKASPADVAMGRTVSGYWADFARTGDPNGDGRPKWPTYDATTEEVLNFTNEGITVGADPFKVRLDLWRAVWERGG